MKFWFVACLWTSWALGAPLPRPDPTPPLSRPSAFDFATSVEAFASLLLQYNYRGVREHELYAAGLESLYRKARADLPDALRGQIESVKKDAWLKLLTDTRLSLRDRPELAKPNDVIAVYAGMLQRTDPSAKGTDRRGHPTSSYSCLGFLFLDRKPYEVVAVFPGGSSQKAGLRPGDQILEDWDRQCTTYEEDADYFPLKVYRNTTQKVLDLKLKHFNYFSDHLLGARRRPKGEWDFFIEPQVALVRISAETVNYADLFSSLLTRLKKDGMRALILDLRQTQKTAKAIHENYEIYPLEVAKLFVEGGTLAVSRSVWGGHFEPKDHAIYGPATAKFADLPITVLVNRFTSGERELLAAALHKRGRASLIGSRTAGNIVKVWNLVSPDGHFLAKPVSGEMLDPRGESLRRGLIPDYPLYLTPDIEEEIQEKWEELSLRPKAQDFSVTMDDPYRDPAIAVAIKLLQPRLGRAP